MKQRRATPGQGRVLKVARTIADLEGADDLLVHDVAGSVEYRGLDRKLWM